MAPRKDEQAGQPLNKVLDDLDRAILAQLQEDGRRSFRQVAKAVDVSEGTVRFRVRRLREAGILEIMVFIDPHQVGYEVSATVLLKVKPRDRQAVIEEIVEWSDVMYVASCTGSADIIFHLVCADHAELAKFVKGRLAAIEGVIAADVLMELETPKARYQYPLLTDSAT
jgi:Lrp/AsnC family transcriptional regulator for asnA, asnC and gidA